MTENSPSGTRKWLLLPLALALALPVAGAALPGRAGAAEAGTARRVSRLSKEAAALYREGDYEGAAEKFLEAYALIPDARIEWNLAKCYERLDRFEEALTWVRRFLERDRIPAAERQRATAFRDRMVAEVEAARAERLLEEARLAQARTEAREKGGDGGQEAGTALTGGAAVGKGPSLGGQGRQAEKVPGGGMAAGPPRPSRGGSWGLLRLGGAAAAVLGLGAIVAGGVILAQNRPIETGVPGATLEVCGEVGDLYECRPGPGYALLGVGGGLLLGGGVAWLIGDPPEPTPAAARAPVPAPAKAEGGVTFPVGEVASARQALPLPSLLPPRRGEAWE